MSLTTIGLHLTVPKAVWIVLKEGFCNDLGGTLEKSMILKDKKDAEKAIANGYQVLELSWCDLQTIFNEVTE